MDVYCAHCNEPWEMYHMRNEAPFDVIPNDRNMTDWEFDNWKRRAKLFASEGTLNTERRRWMREEGWDFGDSLFIIKACPCCKSNGPASQEDQDFVTTMQDISGHDPDGMACDMEDLR